MWSVPICAHFPSSFKPMAGGKGGPGGVRRGGGGVMFCKYLDNAKTQSSLTVKRVQSCHKPTVIQLRPERNKAAELVFDDYHFPLNPLRPAVHPSRMFLVAREWPFIALPYSFNNSLHPKSCLSSLSPPLPLSLPFAVLFKASCIFRL